jgi:hypothetical protein
VLGLCDRFRKLPSEVLAEEAGIIRLLRIEQLGRRRDDGAEGVA